MASATPFAPGASSCPGAPCRGEWRHRGCIVRWHMGLYELCHASGLPMGEANSLDEARQRIDEEIVLLRQRLAAGS